MTAPIKTPGSVPSIIIHVTGQAILLGEARLDVNAIEADTAADLAHYGSSAQWKGIYYRGDKIGFSVGQTRPTYDGYEIREDGRLQMTLLGASTAVRLSTLAVVAGAAE